MQLIYDFFKLSTSADLVDVLINIACAAVISQLIYFVFVRFGNTFSNRRYFGKIFLIVTICTSLIIILLKESLALSLGLVGALSIVRFRAAVKEPEELAYTFLCVAAGLGFGANARGLTLVVVLVVLALLIIRGMISKKTVIKDTYNFSVISETADIDRMVEILSKSGSDVRLRRSDSNGKTVSAQFNVGFSSVSQLKAAVDELKQIDPNIHTSYISASNLI